MIKYNNGIVLKYKNKTSDFIEEIKISLINVKNIRANKQILKFFQDIFGEENDLVINITDDVTCIINLNPGEMAFIDFTSIDIFEEIEYDINLNYNIYSVK